MGIFGSELSGSALSSTIALAMVLVLYVLMSFLWIRQVEGHRRRYQLRIRAFYIGASIYLILLARIWVHGFSQILAILGLVSAALIVINKDNIVNVVGFLIIMWRGLFSENDLIQVQTFRGVVQHVGVLYFSLLEVNTDHVNRITGRVIKVPNGIVSNSPVINFSHTSHLLEQHIELLLSRYVDIEQARYALISLVKKTLHDYYRTSRAYNLSYLVKRHPHLSEKLSLEPQVTFVPKFRKPSGYEVQISFYCFLRDSVRVKEAIYKRVIAADASGETFGLTFEP